MRSTCAGAASGRSWMTTVPPFDRTSVSRLAGLAATAGGGRTLAGTAGGVAGSAAISARAANGNVIKALRMVTHSSEMPSATSARLPPAPALAPALEMPRDIGDHRRRDELVDRSAVARNLLDQPRRDRLQRHVGHQEDRFDAVVELLVHPRHLILIFEIGDRPQAAQDRRGPL